MNIKQSVINTFNRVGIDYKKYSTTTENDGSKVTVSNRFGGDSCETSPLIAHLIAWVYEISNDYEMGKQEVNISDFDRIRYFILEQDSEAYSTCID